MVLVAEVKDAHSESTPSIFEEITGQHGAVPPSLVALRQQIAGNQVPYRRILAFIMPSGAKCVWADKFLTDSNQRIRHECREGAIKRNRERDPSLNQKLGDPVYLPVRTCPYDLNFLSWSRKGRWQNRRGARCGENAEGDHAFFQNLGAGVL